MRERVGEEERDREEEIGGYRERGKKRWVDRREREREREKNERKSVGKTENETKCKKTKKMQQEEGK